MTMKLLTAIAAFGLIASAAQAQSPRTIIWLHSIPPVEFDKPYTGKLSIQRFSVLPCTTSKYACAWRAKDLSWCYIAMGSDKILATAHQTYASVMRHELGHCNGWGADHERDKRISISAIKMPMLPKGTQYFPSDELTSVCLEMDGNPKTCEPDDGWSLCEVNGNLQPCRRSPRVATEAQP